MSYKYALIEEGVVQQVIMSPVVLHFNQERGTWVDISAYHPSPVQGWRYHPESKVFDKPSELELDLDTVKSKAYKAIALAASAARKKLMPDEYGQMELYREKYEQAIDFLSSTDQVNYNDYPLILIEAKIQDVPLKNIAENVIRRRSTWISKLTQIEELRLYGKAHIGFCTNESEVNTLISHLSKKLDDLD